MSLLDEIKMDKSVIEVFKSFEDAEKADRKYWLSKTPEERFEAMEIMRQINFDYDPATDRLLRVLEVVTLDQRAALP